MRRSSSSSVFACVVWSTLIVSTLARATPTATTATTATTGTTATTATTTATRPSPAKKPKKADAKTVTLDVQDADLQNVVRLIGDVAQKNIVMGDDVTGKVTVKLREVAWSDALRVILRSHGYGIVEDGAILWVAPQSRIDDEERAALDASVARELRGPLQTRVVQLNNAKADELANVVRPLLTERGSVAVDTRTNTLIIRDVRTSAALSQLLP